MCEMQAIEKSQADVLFKHDRHRLGVHDMWPTAIRTEQDRAILFQRAQWCEQGEMPFHRPGLKNTDRPNVQLMRLAGECVDQSGRHITRRRGHSAVQALDKDPSFGGEPR